MDLYAVIGNPVEHSQSPFIHQCFAEQTGQALRYDKVLSPLDCFEATVKAFAARGAKGCNITVPFKFEAFALATQRSPRAQRAGAANVLRFDANGWLADNSDGIGLVRDIEANARRPLRGLRVLMLGAGGAAAGALGPLIEAGPAELVLANRTVTKAEDLVASHADLLQTRIAATGQNLTLSARPLHDCGEGFDVFINASASSLSGAEVPVSPKVLKPGALALDMMYGAKAQGFLDWATQHGAEARDGLGMLVEQAAEAFHLWRGLRPDTAPVLLALRERLGLHRP